METKGVTCKIPLELHNRISEEIRASGSTMGKFIEMVINSYYEEKEKGVKIMGKERTMAFQVSEELFQKIKDYLAEYERVYHRRLTQKEFVIGLVEQALEEAEEEFEAARAAHSEAAAEQRSGSQDAVGGEDEAEPDEADGPDEDEAEQAESDAPGEGEAGSDADEANDEAEDPGEDEADTEE